MIKKDTKITIFGLGYIGLPTAALFANSGFNVTGVARNRKRLDLINEGKSPLDEPGLDELVKSAVEKGKLFVTDDGSKASEDADVLIIIVPTPNDKDKNADLTAVMDTCETISKTLKKGSLVIVESTVPQGSCEEIAVPILEKSGLKAGKDFGVAYTPERAIPNNTLYEMTHNARVIGGINKESTDKAAYLYENITKGEIIKVKKLITAETVKLMENTFRDLNIALANEFAIICEKLGIDAIEAINAANHHPRVNIHTPGPGVGGHCLAIDPYFIVETAEKNGIRADLIKTARKINEGMPFHVINLAEEALKNKNKDLVNSSIGILGVAYKGNVPDARETPARPLIASLLSRGAYVLANDPHTPSDEIKSFGAESSTLDEVLECDCVILVTDHDEYKDIEPQMVKNGILICTRPILDPEKFKSEDFIFKGVGRP